VRVTGTAVAVALAAALAFGVTQIEPAAAPELRQREVVLRFDGPQGAPGSSLEGLTLVAQTIQYAGAVAAAELAAMEQATLDAEIATKRAQVAELERQGSQLDEAAATVAYSIPAVWECIHRHEQPDWHAPGRYAGGLGIMTEASDNYREQIDPTFPRPAESATPEQQVQVAEWVLSYAGARAWTTASLCGLE